ncbi:MAG: N-acetylmuramoyl-L-alanine amidase [Peptoniphilus grossensis]|uniref:N-acetylmuramoyl-L-alanine amidase n=1 Tax=Peptoniphilus grossensis TaxID=1465756 RepID=UPI002589FBA1|nr:N-acetylmuramoyl-L-alanine amidase [Peptoniphilus grossensis]MDU5099952.1 N-acetylmuramoyl-L-alanine amidase [Peptoniphilus grossensis]
MRFLFRPIRRNYRSRGKVGIKYLVIHDTGNPNRGAGALNHRNYVENNKRGASAHYFVDDKVIVQYVGDSLSAGSVGDGKGKYGITNANSLSIEMCINSDADYAKTYKNTVELTKNLMKKFNIPIDRVVRHYDASRKSCPNHMRQNNWSKWWKFKEDIKKPIEWQIDLSKDCVFGSEVKVIEKDYFSTNGLKIIKTTPDKIYIQQLGGKTLRKVGAYGINGTFFDTKNPELPSSTWGIAINKGKAIGPNSDKNHWNKSIKRGTIIYGEGKLTVERINNISEVKRKVDWAIGGVGLYPSFDPRTEQVPQDILRYTNHSGIAFKNNIIYLIVSEPCTMYSFKEKILKLNVDGAIALDGGGSTQMFYKNNFGIHTTRKLNNIVGVMS